VTPRNRIAIASHTSLAVHSWTARPTEGQEATRSAPVGTQVGWAYRFAGAHGWRYDPLDEAPHLDGLVRWTAP
jgi:hypothetical protein